MAVGKHAVYREENEDHLLDPLDVDARSYDPDRDAPARQAPGIPDTSGTATTLGTDTGAQTVQATVQQVEGETAEHNRDVNDRRLGQSGLHEQTEHGLSEDSPAAGGGDGEGGQQAAGGDGDESEEVPPYDKWNADDLKDEARNRGISGFSQMHKNELVKALEKHDRDAERQSKQG